MCYLNLRTVIKIVLLSRFVFVTQCEPLPLYWESNNGNKDNSGGSEGLSSESMERDVPDFEVELENSHHSSTSLNLSNTENYTRNMYNADNTYSWKFYTVAFVCCLAICLRCCRKLCDFKQNSTYIPTTTRIQINRFEFQRPQPRAVHSPVNRLPQRNNVNLTCASSSISSSDDEDLPSYDEAIMGFKTEQII